MTEQRLEKLWNKAYYYYLEREEAQELIDYYENMEQENKQLKEQLENKIDLYEDTISYQLGFDKGKEKYYQALLDIKEYIERNKGSWEVSTFSQREDVRKIVWTNEELDILDIVNKALGDKENEET